MHCAPCCDKTYEMYSPELWECIPELQAALDDIHKKLRDATVVEQLRQINANSVWMDFNHEEQWNGWTIRVKLYDNPKTHSHPYEFTVWDNGNKKHRRTNARSYPSLLAAVSQAKEFISKLKDQQGEQNDYTTN